MPEPIVTVGLGAIAAYLGKDGVAKILGPTADYLGGELQEFTKKRIDNVGKIFQRAGDKLGRKLEQPGMVSPKVLKTIINEGSYSEDEIAIEYFGGVLASSRTEISRDDRGARVAKAIDNLSCYQIRCHYLVYSTISNLFKNSNSSLKRSSERENLELYFPMVDFYKSMGFVVNELQNPQILDHIFHGLSSDGLIAEKWAYGPVDALKVFGPCDKIVEPGVVCTPTAKGAELFLWGFGLGDSNLNFIFDNGFRPTIAGIPEMINRSFGTKI